MDSGIGQFSGRAAPQVGFVETVENCSRKPRVVRRWPDVPWPLHIARSSALWHTGSAHWTVHCILHKAAHGICSLLTGRCIELGGVCCSLGRYWIRQTCLPSVGDSGAAGSSHRRPYLTSAKYFGFHLQLSLVQCARSNGDALTSRDRKGHNLICKPDTHECMCAESDPLKCIDLSSGNWFVQTKIDFPRPDNES